MNNLLASLHCRDSVLNQFKRQGNILLIQRNVIKVQQANKEYIISFVQYKIRCLCPICREKYIKYVIRLPSASSVYVGVWGSFCRGRESRGRPRMRAAISDSILHLSTSRLAKMKEVTFLWRYR